MRSRLNHYLNLISLERYMTAARATNNNIITTITADAINNVNKDALVLFHVRKC